MTKGEAYDKGVRKDQYTGSYGEFKPQHVKSDGERYPNDVVFFEEDHDDFVYVKRPNRKAKFIIRHKSLLNWVDI